MLKMLRKKGTAKKVIWALTIVIIFSFGFFGTAYLIAGKSGTEYAGKIFGKRVSLDDFSKYYRNTRIQAIRQYGANLEKVAHLLNLEGQTWDRMILLHEANRRRIRVPNEKIIQSIQEDKSFEKDGRFDMLLYNAILRSLQIRPRDYEEHVRDNLKIAELYRLITSSVTVNDNDVFEEYKKRNEKVQVSYVYVPFDRFIDDVQVDNREVEQYFEDHKSDFLVAPSVNVRYLTFAFPEPEIETTGGQDGADNAIETEKDRIRDQADTAFRELLIDPDMEKVAAQYGLPVKTSGFFSMEQPNLALGWSYDLLNKIFGMKINEVHEPFETPTGMTIAQIKAKKDSSIPAFAETQEKAREALTKEKSKEIARRKAQEYLVSIKEEMDRTKVKDFAKVAKALELEIHQTPEFTRGQYLPQIGISNEFQSIAFDLNDKQSGEVSDVVETAKGFCLLYLDHYTPIDKAAYEEAKDGLAQTISDEKKNTLFADFLTELRQESGLIDNIASSQASTVQ